MGIKNVNIENDSDLMAVVALSFAESVHVLVDTECKKSRGEYPTPYGGEYGFAPATTRLMEACNYFEPEKKGS